MPTARLRRAHQNAAEEELRAGRPGVLGAVADPDVGNPPVPHGGMPQVAAAPDEVGFGMRIGRVLRQPDPGLAGAAQMDDQQLEVVRVRRALRRSFGQVAGSENVTATFRPMA